MPLSDSRPLTPGQRFLFATSKTFPERSLSVASPSRSTTRRAVTAMAASLPVVVVVATRRLTVSSISAATSSTSLQRCKRSSMIQTARQILRSSHTQTVKSATSLHLAVFKEGDTLLSVNERVEFGPGYSMPLAIIPPATKIHAIELHPGRGAQIARSAGQSAQLVSVDGDRARSRCLPARSAISTHVAAQRSVRSATTSTKTKALVKLVVIAGSVVAHAFVVLR